VGVGANLATYSSGTNLSNGIQIFFCESTGLYLSKVNDFSRIGLTFLNLLTGNVSYLQPSLFKLHTM